MFPENHPRNYFTTFVYPSGFVFFDDFHMKYSHQFSLRFDETFEFINVENGQPILNNLKIVVNLNIYVGLMTVRFTVLQFPWKKPVLFLFKFNELRKSQVSR